jgi:hypothetical protein
MKVKIKVQSVTKLVMMTFQYMLEDKTKLRETIENLSHSIVFILLIKAKVTYIIKFEPYSFNGLGQGFSTFWYLRTPKS